jgi:hypothetical protein
MNRRKLLGVIALSPLAGCASGNMVLLQITKISDGLSSELLKLPLPDALAQRIRDAQAAISGKDWKSGLRLLIAVTQDVLGSGLVPAGYATPISTVLGFLSGFLSPAAGPNAVTATEAETALATLRARP